MPHGKILRIDPRGTNSANGKYGIPPPTRSSASRARWARSTRSACATRTGSAGTPAARTGMFLGHIGEHDIEAVYDVRAGDNFGWSEREGPFVFNQTDRCNLYPLPEDDAKFGYIYPVAAYDHNPPPGWPCTRDGGHAISGGFVYRGDLPGLFGKYLFGDLVDGRIFYTNADEMRRGRHAGHDPRDEGLRHRRVRRCGCATSSATTGSTCASAPTATASSTCWPRRTARSGRSPAPRPLPDRPDVVHPSLRRTWSPTTTSSTRAPHDPAREGPGLARARRSTWSTAAADAGATTARTRPATRVADSNRSTRRSPGNDDWKAGIYGDGVPTLHAFNGTAGATVMGWVKMTGRNPSPNPGSPTPDDRYGAIGLAGVLTGDSDGHGVRALLELINVNGEMRLVALGRRIDGGASQTFAASADWQTAAARRTSGCSWPRRSTTTRHHGAVPQRQAARRVLREPGDPWQLAGTGRTSPTPTRAESRSAAASRRTHGRATRATAAWTA